VNVFLQLQQDNDSESGKQNSSLPEVLTYYTAISLLPSVLQRCWLGIKKSIRPAKMVLAWLSVSSEVQMWSS